MPRISYRTESCSQVVLEQRSSTHRCSLVIKLSAQIPDIVVVEINRRPRMETQNMQMLVISLRLRKIRLGQAVAVDPTHPLRFREILFLSGQCLCDFVFVYGFEIHCFTVVKRCCVKQSALRLKYSEI